MPVPSGLFAGDAPHEPRHVDDEALVGAFTHTFLFVVGLHRNISRRPSRPVRVARKTTRMPIGVAAR